MKTVLLFLCVALAACTTVDHCDRSSVGNSCYWLKAYEPNAQGHAHACGNCGRGAAAGGFGHGKGF